MANGDKLAAYQKSRQAGAKAFVDNSAGVPVSKPAGGVGLLDKAKLDWFRNRALQDNTAVRTDVVSPEIREANKYYNPDVIGGISSGSVALDALYRNQWLMNAPVVGGVIKNLAHNVASNSGGQPILENSSVSATGRGSYAGQSHSEDRTNGQDLLSVYFGKKSLPASKYKPTQDYMEFLPSYSIKGDFETKEDGIRDNFPEILSDVVSGGYEGKEGLDPKKESEKSISAFLKDKKPVYLSVDESNDFLDSLGADLGGHKVGMAWDDEVDLPYMSISDAWDFSPGHYAKKWGDEGDNPKDRDKAYIQASLMHKAGEPFKVYDRFYFDPKTKNYISDADVDNRRK